MSDASYLRCRHCKGFYETSFARCKWCAYDDPVPERDGSAKVYADRETCRAIQLAEFEQLPAEARDDPMAPPKDEPALLCACLHCGPDGHRYEAIEMRWIVNEGMWACPCTTCGGRGFGIDVHSAENKWQCAECGHFYVPANHDYRSDNAHCPKCGSTMANGWFDDGDEDEFEDEFDDDVEAYGKLVEGGEAGAAANSPEIPFADASLPWDDDDEAYKGYVAGVGGGQGWVDGDDDDDDRRLPDDIDFPHGHRSDLDIKDDDIPF